MNKTGLQFQKWDNVSDSMLKATYPHSIKYLQTGSNLASAFDWRSHRPNGVLCLRYVGNDSEPLEDWEALTTRLLNHYASWQNVGGKIICETPWNERFHTNINDFRRLCKYNLLSARKIKAAGFIPGVLITSEGNPPGLRPDDPYGMDFWLDPEVQEYLVQFRALGCIWCPHGYSHPPTDSNDPWHSQRPTEVLSRLPEHLRLNWFRGESGCDGGTAQPNQKPGVGWTGYFGSIGDYAYWQEKSCQDISNDELCVGDSIFLCNHLPPWLSFDVKDEVDFRYLLTKDFSGPAIKWLDGGSPVTPGEQERYFADIFKRANVPYTPDHALVKYWRDQAKAGRYLGAPEETEHETENGKYIVQAFASAILHAEINVWVPKEGLPPLT